MRTLTGHHDGHGLNERLRIETDEPDPKAGGAPHNYRVRYETGSGVNLNTEIVATIQFQHGPRDEPGSLPGITDAALLEIVADRMRNFNAAQFACRENALTLTKIEEAIHWLRALADARAKRGVLGKNEK